MNDARLPVFRVKRLDTQSVAAALLGHDLGPSERDDWDELMVHNCETGSWLAAVLITGRFCVWLTRWVLWVFMGISQALSCFLMRQMELDADRVAARLAGMKAFESTEKQLLLFGTATEQAYWRTFAAWYERGRLPDDMSQLVVTLANDMEAKTLRRLERRMKNEGPDSSNPADLHLIVLAPALTRPYREELKTLDVTLQAQEPGIWRLQGGMALHPTWILETEVLAGLNHPLLTLVSPTFLKQGLATYQLLRQGGYTELVVYLSQQIRQFRSRGEEFAMQHLGAEEELKQVWREMLADMSPQERLEGLSPNERLEGLSPNERLEGLSPNERLEGLSPKELLEGLTPAQREQLRQLLEQARPANGSRT